jgi:hypothetical protein
MSSQPIYFQWQNEFLQSTIYPLREMKLRDFLVFFYEIDIWAEYKTKTMADLKDEEAAYRKSQTALWEEAYDNSQVLKEYFLKPDVTEDYRKKYPTPSARQMQKINELHGLFKTYFPKITHPANERYFVSQRIMPWETARKEIVRLIEENKRKLRNMGPTWGRKAQVEQETKELEEVTLKMADDELNKLYAFLSAITRIEKRRLELKKWRDDKTKEKGTLTQRWQKAAADAAALAAKHKTAAENLMRLKNPPVYETLEAHFAKEDMSGEYQALFQEVDTAFITKVNQMHRTVSSHFKIQKVDASRAFFLKGQLSQMELLRKQLEVRIAELERFLRNMGPTWAKKEQSEQEIAKIKRSSLPIVLGEVDKMNQMMTVLNNRGKPKATLDALIAQEEKNVATLTQQLDETSRLASQLENELKVLESSVGMPEKELLMNFLGAQPVTVRDIVIGKVEAYRKELAEKNQYELLEIILTKFKQNPKRYPLWLQYMVVHFSGMRYQSAHGSWADPKDLLLALRMKAIEKEMKRADDSVIEAQCEEKLSIYEPVPGQPPNPNAVRPKLVNATEQKWKNKLGWHIRGIKSQSPYHRRTSLLNLRVDEENYEIEVMPDPEALKALEGMKDDFPAWMWNEIVRLTDLRVKEVSDKNWETLTEDQQEERMEAQWSEFRGVMDEWKKQNLTGWREEHDRANKLVVSRAVCNEVAEHIQHIRGNTPPGGLTAKPEWYMRQERDPKLVAKPEKPIFLKPRNPTDFKEGSSVLWLSFVYGQPNQWRIARPMTVRGEGLLSPGLIGGSGPRPSNPNAPGAWDYMQDAGAIRRKRRTQDAKGQHIQEEQWLRWLHEATVAAVGETAEGMVVLTFETALPYEDKRQSTIGVFRHYYDYIKHTVNREQFIASFIGYTPTGNIPYNDLREMLDWDRILLKKFGTPQEKEAFWKEVGYVPTRAVEPVRPAIWLEAAPGFTTHPHRDWILAYETDLKTRTAKVYEPTVELRRGYRMKVALAEIVRVEGETYHRVLECEDEPLAQDLFVRKNECIETTREKTPLFVNMAKTRLLFRLVGADDEGKPIFRKSKVKLFTDTRLQVSGVHKIGPADAGDGLVSDGKYNYYLILNCPGQTNAKGLFVRADQVKAGQAPPTEG